MSLLSVLLTGTPEAGTAIAWINCCWMVYSSVCQLFIELTTCTFTRTCIFLNVQMYLNSLFFKPSILWNLIKNVFGLWIFHKFPFSIWISDCIVGKYAWNGVLSVNSRPKQEIQQNTRNHCETVVLMSITGVLYYKLNR